MATAARFSAGSVSLAGSRANAAQRAGIFWRVASSNGQIIPLDYNTSAIDEMMESRRPGQALAREPGPITTDVDVEEGWGHTIYHNTHRWLWVPAPVRNCALGGDDGGNYFAPTEKTK